MFFKRDFNLFSRDRDTKSTVDSLKSPSVGCFQQQQQQQLQRLSRYFQVHLHRQVFFLGPSRKEKKKNEKTLILFGTFTFPRVNHGGVLPPHPPHTHIYTLSISKGYNF